MTRGVALCSMLSAGTLAGCLGTYTPAGPDDPNALNNNPMNQADPNAPVDPGPAAMPDMAEAIDLAGPPSTGGTLSLSGPSATQPMRFNDSKDIVVNVTPAGGFNGQVVYSIEGLPTGVTGTFTPPGGIVSSATTTTLTLKTISNLAPAAALAFTVKGVSGAISGTTPVAISIAAELYVPISKGVALGSSGSPNKAAFGVYGMPTLFIAPGTKVTWQNLDAINHEIHSDGTLGIQHEGGKLLANGANSYTQTFNKTGTFNYRCHVHPNMLGQIVVK